MTLAQFAQLVVLDTERRMTRDTLAARVEPLRRGGIVAVDGEMELLAALDHHLREADHALEQAAVDEAMAPRLLGEVGQHLHDVDWDLADDVLRNLSAREETHREAGKKVQAEVLEWQSKVNELAPKLDDANRLGALVATENEEFRVIESLVSTASSAAAGGMYLDAAGPLHRLRTGRATLPGSRSGEPAKELSIRPPDDLLKAVDAALARAHTLAGHTELVLLRTSPADAEEIEYVSILRMPRARVTHTVSVRATRTLARSDFDHICSLTKRVGMAEGTRRRRHLAPAGDRQRLNGPDDPDVVRRELRTLGELLYRLVIPESVQRLLETHEGQVTITTNEQELPWELVRIRDTHLANLCPVARMPLGWTMPRIGRARSEGLKLRFLLIHADPAGDLPGAAIEVETIREGLERDWGGRIDVVVIEPEKATSELLNETLLGGEYDVIHYAGHARFDESRPDRSGLLLSGNRLFTADKVERLLAGQPLVFLNACESSMTANEPEAPSYLGHQSEGLASAFLYGGAMACVGSRWPVFDKSAGELAVTFYKHLLQGNMVGEALRLARAESYATRGDEVTWATYTLYGDPGFHITTPEAAGAPSGG
jgi:hypothetical protein